MKTKTNNKLNILLIAVTLLLLFVACASALGKTNSWLVDKEEIGFELNVQEINIEIKQDTRQIADTGYIYLGTNLIEANKTYPLNVTITNKESGVGYYIRFQAFAVVNGVTYNINDCVISDFYDHADDDQEWLYSVDENDENVAMTAGQTLILMQSVTFPESFVSSIQGQYVKLHLFVEGSATGVFDTASE